MNAPDWMSERPAGDAQSIIVREEKDQLTGTITSTVYYAGHKMLANGATDGPDWTVHAQHARRFPSAEHAVNVINGNVSMLGCVARAVASAP